MLAIIHHHPPDVYLPDSPVFIAEHSIVGWADPNMKIRLKPLKPFKKYKLTKFEHDEVI